MTEKQKKDIQKKTSSDIVLLITKKIMFFEDVIQKTILQVQQNKMLDIIGVSEVNNCINTLFDLSGKIREINETQLEKNTNINTDNVINVLQNINNELSCLFKLFGTESFEDLLWICFGNNSVNTYAISDMDKHKFELLKKYFHPTCYRLLSPKKVDFVKPETMKHSDECTLTEKSKNLDAVDVSIKIKPFHSKVYGIQLIVHNPQHKKSLIISGTVDDIIIDLLDNKFINLKLKAIKDNIPNSVEFQGDTFHRYMSSLSLKDFLIYETHEIYSRYAGYLSNLNNIRQKTIAQVIKEFISADLFAKRSTIIQLLVKQDKYDNQYLAYLLYDLLSNDKNGCIDTIEQTILFDSFPWSIKQFFKDAMKNTVQYTNELTNFETNKIPLEQQICLLKAPDSVKEKAMQKLKEVKAKSEDSGSKARQYLDGLLKIPFSIYKREPILNIMNEIKSDFRNLLVTNNIMNIELKETYSSLEILKWMRSVKPPTPVIAITNNVELNYNQIINKLLECSKLDLTTYILKINEIINKNKLTTPKLKYSNKNKSDMINLIGSFIQDNSSVDSIIKGIKEIFVSLLETNGDKIKAIQNNVNLSSATVDFIKKIEEKYETVNKYMITVKTTLDSAVHAHEKAKKQVERIVAQWISGNDNTGYVLGFEGSPGIGKTTLAKGLANCLKDNEGNSRPFSLIAIGGDANSSSLVGHSYTYVGSTWGQIVQILMDKKCMNPIILIDEVDKISKTEHGKEIIGILTHLLDTTQNDTFQDKYFSGIDLDLSKVLFILSYNDVEAIDKILLDRVHRIKFDNLSIEDKIEISNKHLLPEMYNKLGLTGMISILPETLKFIIEEYTLEPGVRKLKEKLFEIIGEINLEMLKNMDLEFSIPIIVTVDDIKQKYFKDKREVRVQKIHEENRVGMINCLYATSLGSSGILSASAKFFPAEKFLDLKLTGLLDQMMQESFQISLTLAYSLLSLKRQEELNIMYKNQGIHLHMGDGSVSKSGTSAGIAITLLIYSLLNNKKIKNTFAVTGEASDLNGKVGEIGALAYKFKGGIKAGVKNFIFPKENAKDFDEFMTKYGSTSLVEGICFYQISHIQEAIDLIMETE
jgi:ATP-dependent Lon protease